MKLIGRYDSPYVRRVGVSLHVLGIAFERLPLSPFSQANDLRHYNPAGRMPAIVLADGEVLIDSSAILDHLDEIAGPSRALVPPRGEARRKAMKIIAMAVAACDKTIAINYERRRPADKVYTDWIDRCRVQIDAAIAELESMRASAWPSHQRLMQVDITTAAMLDYVRRVEPEAVAPRKYPGLDELARDCEAHPAFTACPPGADRAN
jgi:glutathione S-transferase